MSRQTSQTAEAERLALLARSLQAYPLGTGRRDEYVTLPGPEGQRGTTIRYVRAGRGRSPIVLLHGLGSLLYEWRSLLKALDDNPRSIAYAFDMKGSGFSEKPGSGHERASYGLDAFVAVTEGFLAALRIKRAVLIGQGLGGAVALKFAATHPDCVSRLVLLSPTVYPSPQPLLIKILRLPVLGSLMGRAMSRPRPLERWLSGTRSNLRTWLYQRDRITSELIRQYAMPLMDTGTAYAYRQTALQLNLETLPPLFAHITMPTQILWGAEDQINRPQLAEQLAKDLPRARLTLIPQAGHACSEDQPGAVNEAILAFLNE